MECALGAVSHPHSSQDSSRSSGDRDTFRSSRGSGDRNHYRRPGGWDNRDRGYNWNRQHSQDRWHHYDNRRPGRGGGWEWNH